MDSLQLVFWFFQDQDYVEETDFDDDDDDDDDEDDVVFEALTPSKEGRCCYHYIFSIPLYLFIY